MFETWQQSIPECTKECALILFLLNICFPPFGTLIMACISKPFSTDQLLVGILQILTLPLCCVGWVWSIWWGYLCYMKGGDNIEGVRRDNGPAGAPDVK
jgi:hypothetical protein